MGSGARTLWKAASSRLWTDGRQRGVVHAEDEEIDPLQRRPARRLHDGELEGLGEGRRHTTFLSYMRGMNCVSGASGSHNLQEHGSDRGGQEAPKTADAFANDPA